MIRYLRRISLFLAPTVACAFPPTMDIGTFAIDNYSANGGGMSNLTYQIASGQNFFAGAYANIPGYSAALAGGTSGPNFALDRRDTQVSKSAITSTSSSYGSREYADFIFYGGHGLGGGLYLGAGGGYGSVLPAELGMGAGYNRWFMAASCLVFSGGVPATTWAGTFKGLKAMLGFESIIFDNNQSWELYNEFWLNWTWREKSLLNAFFDAQANYGYAHMYPSLGLKPGCLSAQVPSNRIDYCRESFKWTEKNYNKATASSGYYYNRVIGSPIY
jgi:Family of unknown function (DUF6345)